LKDWPLRELRRRHTLALVDHMLRVEGRATTGAVGILSALSAMAEDAITDEVCDLNPFKGVRIRANDPRAKMKPRPIRVFTFEEMHRFAKAAGRYESMVRVFTDCGLRLGEVLPLRRRPSRFATPPTRARSSRGRRPTTASPAPAALSPSPRPSSGCSKPRSRSTTRTASCSSDATRSSLARAHLLPRPLEAGPRSLRPRYPAPRVPPQLCNASSSRRVIDADLAEIAGHRVETMLARYTHPVGNSFPKVATVIG